MDVPGLVETSLNLGIMRTNDDSVSFSWAVRSSVRSRKTLLIDKLDLMAKRLGGSISISGDYPEWSYDPDSKICALSGRLYEELTGRRAVTETIHDSHNIIVIGDNDADIIAAVREIERAHGGYTIVSGGEGFDTLELPVMGLISDKSYTYVNKKLKRMIAQAHRM